MKNLRTKNVQIIANRVGDIMLDVKYCLEHLCVAHEEDCIPEGRVIEILEEHDFDYEEFRVKSMRELQGEHHMSQRAAYADLIRNKFHGQSTMFS